MSATIPPRKNELELSLFGKGVGECLVIHLGNDQWIIVDSFMDSVSEKPVGQAYLESMGVKIDKQVSLIVCTHWHDDHIAGMARLLQTARSAKFACSSALCCNEFWALVEAGKKVKLVEHSSSVAEFREILEQLKERSGKSGAIGPDFWASEGKVLFERSDPPSVQVRALSPSAQTCTDAKVTFSNFIPKIGDQIGRYPDMLPNDTSIVLFIAFPDASLLLGSDIPSSNDKRKGWRAIIASSVRPRLKSFCYKVAHHGSEMSDMPEIWDELLENNAIAALTTYLRGPKKLPSSVDVTRLKGRSDKVYCTRNLLDFRMPKATGTVDRMMNSMVKSRLVIPKKSGHIRIRKPIGISDQGSVVELFNGAIEL